MKKINPYLNFNGRCEEALRFYGEHLDAKIQTVMPFEGSPAAAQVPGHWQKKIMHSSILIGDSVIMMSDGMPDKGEKPQGFSVTLHVDTAEDAKRIFNALADQGTIRMPLDKTFFASSFGMLIDRFNIPWMIICEQKG